MKNIVCLVLILGLLSTAKGQDTTSIKNSVWDRLYFNWFDVGMIMPNSSALSNTIIFKSATEYRFRKSDGLFIRFSSESSSPTYQLQVALDEINVIEGELRIQDWLIGLGYRVGEQRFRGTLAMLYGVRRFNFPTYEIQNNTIQILDKKRFQGTASLVFSCEFYITSNILISLSGFYNHAFKQDLFWEDGQSAVGITFGLSSSF